MEDDFIGSGGEKYNKSLKFYFEGFISGEIDGISMVHHSGCSIHTYIFSTISIPHGISAFALREKARVCCGPPIHLNAISILRRVLTHSGRLPNFQNPQNFFGSMVSGIINSKGTS